MSDEIKTRFGQRVLELRKQHAWKQDELGKKIGTSGVIVGRYERGEMMPSIEVAQKLAEVFGVTVDSLTSSNELPNLLQQSAMVERWTTLDQLAPADRDRILFVFDSLIREAKTREAFSSP